MRGAAERGRVSAALLCLDVHVPTAGECDSLLRAVNAGNVIAEVPELFRSLWISVCSLYFFHVQSSLVALNVEIVSTKVIYILR